MLDYYGQGDRAMLNRKGVDETHQEQLPRRDALDGTNAPPRHPLTENLDYGLMDDLPSGKDSFFCPQGQASRPAEAPTARCPGFANQCPDAEQDVIDHSTSNASATGNLCRHCAPNETARQQPLVDFGLFESGSSECEGPIRPAPSPSADPIVRPKYQEGNQSHDNCSGRTQRSEKDGLNNPAEPIVGPEEFRAYDKTAQRSSSWSQLKDHKFVSNSGRILSHILAVSRDFVKTKRRTIVPAVAAVLLVLAFLYLAQPKPYSVETRLMFIPGDGHMPDPQWSVDKEAKYFSNTNVVYTLAQKLFEGQNGTSAVRRLQNQDTGATPQSRRRVVGDGRDRFKSPGEFIKWLVKASALETDNSSVPARITLKLTGKDPKFLKAVSENYIRSYVEFRRTIPAPVLSQVNSSSQIDGSTVPPVLKTISERLQTFEIQEREYELALNLIDSGKSHFAGFIPKESMVEANSLAHFQQKIVQLELTKNSLLLKYAPESREVRTVEAEIQAARKAMRQCLVEQLRFVKHNRELLLTQKMELEKGLTAPVEMRPKPQHPDQSESAAKRVVTTDAPVSLGNGLYLVWDKPALTEKPLLSKVGDATGKLVAGVQQSIDSVRDAKDSLITGLYNTLVSEDARNLDSDVEDDQSPKSRGRYIVRQ